MGISRWAMVAIIISLHGILFSFVSRDMLLLLGKELVCSPWKWDLLEFSWQAPVPFLSLFTATAAPPVFRAKARNKLPRHLQSLHSQFSAAALLVCKDSGFNIRLFCVLCSARGGEVYYILLPPHTDHAVLSDASLVTRQTAIAWSWYHTLKEENLQLRC